MVPESRITTCTFFTRPSHSRKDDGILTAGGQAAWIRWGVAIALPPKMEDNPTGSWRVGFETFHWSLS
jgi:hypothetical protein